jgi:ribosomal protein S27E
MEKEILLSLIKKEFSIGKIAKELNKTSSQVRYLLKKYKLKTNGVNAKYKWDKESILSSIKKSECKSDVLRGMNIPIKSGNFQTLDRYCKEYSIDISHLRYKNNRGNKSFNIKKIKDEDVFIENSKFTSSYHLKKRVVSSGYLEDKCYKCGNEGVWCGEPLSLQIDHINGIRYDHRLVNLRIACPNCHSQTITYRGKKNKINRVKEKKVRVGKLKFNITKEELEKLIWQIPTTKIAKMYNVSGNAIAKRCKKFGIKKPSRGYF